LSGDEEAVDGSDDEESQEGIDKIYQPFAGLFSSAFWANFILRLNLCATFYTLLSIHFLFSAPSPTRGGSG